MNSLFLGNRSLFVNGMRLSAIDSAPGPTPSLPPYTIRLKFTEGVTPAFAYGTGVQVSSSPNVWDLTYENASWSRLLRLQTDLLEVIAANTTYITSMDNMFNACSALTAVSLFDTSTVTNMNGLFSSCSSLTTVPLFDTSSVANMNTMFNNCTSLTTVPLFNTSLVTNMSLMFNGCTSLTTVPLFNTSGVTNISSMFNGCSALTTVPLFNTQSATTMASMFRNCTSLTAIPLFITSSVKRINYAFFGCIKVQTGALALYQQASSQATPPTSYTQAFHSCGSDTTTGAAELAQIPDEWK